MTYDLVDQETAALSLADEIRKNHTDVAASFLTLKQLSYLEAGYEVLGEATEVAQSMAGRYQLGLLSLVSIRKEMPTHTRLEHTCGVMALAALGLEVLRTRGLPLDQAEAFLVIMAAALHDAAHLPISHATERALYQAWPNRLISTKHEDRASRMLVHPPTQGWRQVAEAIEPVYRRLGGGRPPFESVKVVAGLIMGNAPESDDIKEAHAQLLSSPIDVDRLDYLLRDAIALEYDPVTQMRENLCGVMGSFIPVSVPKGLVDTGAQHGELAVSESDLPWVYSLLVARLLMYKNAYFSADVRATEGTLTRLVTILIDNHVFADPLALLQLSDEDFLRDFLPELIAEKSQVLAKGQARAVQEDLELLKQSRARYKYITSVNVAEVAGEPLRRIVGDHYQSWPFRAQFGDLLAQRIRENAHGSALEYRIGQLTKYDILVDPFSLKPEKGDPLWFRSDKGEIQSVMSAVNGSNIHGLVEEHRIDFYCEQNEVVTLPTHVEGALAEIFGKGAVYDARSLAAGTV